MVRMRTSVFASLLLAILPLSTPGGAQTAVPAFTLPPSNQLSPQALEVLARMRGATAQAEIAGDIAKRRAFYDRYNDDRLAEMRRHFRTTERRETMDGVTVDIVEPAGGVPQRNQGRVLINVHGGAFIWGSGSGALVEAIPIAATMGVRVVTVDYRLAPEHHYPAASQDVEAVYRALLKSYKPGAIGIYGCSAGGIITAQSTAWLRAAGLPRPGAIGTFCGTGAPYSGDAPYLAAATMGEAIPTVQALPEQFVNPYMDGVPISDPRAYPMLSDEEVGAMPPTLLLAGGRDFATGALTLAHRRLAGAGVPSQLHLFDGLPHAFFMWPDMPESLEAFRLISTFFEERLEKGDRP